MNKAKGNRGKNTQNKSNLVTPSSGAAIATHSTNPLEGNTGGGNSRIRIDWPNKYPVLYLVTKETLIIEVLTPTFAG